MATTDQLIGERIHHLMWRQRMTQARLAKVLGITQTGISKKIHGDRPWFASELLDVAAALNTQVTALLPENEELPRLDSNQQPFDDGATSPRNPARPIIVSLPLAA
jgi:transcriptional regulator with XRE-family HTH domain